LIQAVWKDQRETEPSVTEALNFATQAAEANPEFPDIYAVLASANGHLGRIAEAREALDQLVHRMPNLTASGYKHATWFRKEGQLQLTTYSPPDC
jgi:uncharacterized protein YdcH (DUF465 family)